MNEEDYTITMTEGARTVLRNVRNKIADAEAWVERLDFMDVYGITWDDQEGQISMIRSLRGELNKMKLSWYEGLAKILVMGRNVRLTWDSDDSLYWVCERDHGALVFHANYYNDQRLPVGTWSMHT